MDINPLLETSLEAHGAQTQFLKIIEEAAEVGVELARHLQNPEDIDTLDHLCEETGDIEIVSQYLDLPNMKIDKSPVEKGSPQYWYLRFAGATAKMAFSATEYLLNPTSAQLHSLKLAAAEVMTTTEISKNKLPQNKITSWQQEKLDRLQGAIEQMREKNNEEGEDNLSMASM